MSPFMPVLTGAFVALGTALAGRPPHRSGLEELPHPALTSGNEREGAGLDTGEAYEAWEAID